MKKKLIEVALPLEAINTEAAREKNIRHGHPSTLHLWWARRPLAACRAVIFAQLVDDPSSNPELFPSHEAQDKERQRLFKIIEELVKWENSNNQEVLDAARVEIKRSCNGELPSVYDPFSGGGSIPLEAQRLGVPAYGSDLNPVAVMIGKAMIEIPPKFRDQTPVHPGPHNRNHYRNSEGLAEDVKHYGEWMRDQALDRIGHLYPKIDVPGEYGGGRSTVIAWIWSRTVPSPDPAFSGVSVPIASSFLLSSKSGQEAWIEPLVDREKKIISFSIRNGGTRDEIDKAKKGTKVGRANFRCLLSGAGITADYVKNCGKNGEIGESLIAIVTEVNNKRIFLAPNNIHAQVARDLEDDPIVRLCRDTFLSGETPAKLTGGTCHGYGLDTWGKLFTGRQLIALKTYADLVQEAKDKVYKDALAAGLKDDETSLSDGGENARAYADSVAIYLGFGVSRLSDILNSLCRWESSKTQVRNLFGRQAIPMLWDFGENNVFGNAAGDYRTSLGSIVKVIERFVPRQVGEIRNIDAQTVEYPNPCVISTDPPYYDNIGYSDLSDFFFCWMKAVIRPIYPDLFGVLATPKADELVATAHRHGGKENAEKFFLDGMKDAIANMASQSSPDFPATIYYAFKQSEVDEEGVSSTGWATFLQAVIEAGYSIVGTWPMRTEMANRMIASRTNALANSVVLVCRRRENSAPSVSRAEFLRILKKELPVAISELQSTSIAPADMPQSAIGPGIGVFTRFGSVLEADDSPMPVKTALQLINRELDEYLNDIQGEFDPETRFAITWFEQNGLGGGDSGVAISIAQARGISVESVQHAGIVEYSAGSVRLLTREELLDNWDPTTDPHITVWECLQYLIRQYETSGVSSDTALLFKKIGGRTEAVRDLAYCLYDISANKRKDAKEATSFNSIISDWNELTNLAASVHDGGGSVQMDMEI